MNNSDWNATASFMEIWYADYLLDVNPDFDKDNAMAMASMTPMVEILEIYIEQKERKEFEQVFKKYYDKEN